MKATSHKYQLRILEHIKNECAAVFPTVKNSWILNLNLLAVDDLEKISGFSLYELEEMGHRLRDELIQKWVSAGRKETITEEI